MARLIKRYIRKILRPIPQCYGRVFARQYEFLQKSQWWSVDELTRYQVSELQRLLDHCSRHVPYYRDLFQVNRFRPADFRRLEDLKNLPVLTKDFIRDNADSLLAENVRTCDREFHTTGGTSGNPLGLFIEKRTNLLRLAFEWRFYNWSGRRFGDRCVVLRGQAVPETKKGKAYEFDPFKNHLILSSYDMSDENMAEYLRLIAKFKPAAIDGYPSTLDLLATFALENNAMVDLRSSLKAVVTSSETLYPFQREKIMEAFGVPVFDLYGNTEQAGRAGECDRREGHHDFSEYGITELDSIDSTGNGEIVATGFTNYAMPLIRYKTGDFARWSTKPCSCGRALPLLQGLTGRAQDFVITRSGLPVPVTGYFFAAHTPEMSSIRKLQFLQERRGELTAFVVRGKNYRAGDTERMIARMNGSIKEPMTVHIHYVEEIEGSRLGKHRFFVQRLTVAR
jgi:phenylacetate-CoA ligase